MKLFPVVFIVILLSACAELPTPAASGQAAPSVMQATLPADYMATYAVAAAQATYAAQSTGTAAAGTQQAAQAQSTALAAQTTATADALAVAATVAAATRTQSAWEIIATATKWAAVGARESATVQAIRATQTATAAIPAMTATHAAVMVQEERNQSQWYLALAVLSLLALAAIVAGYNFANSLGAEREAKAKALLVAAQAEAELTRARASRDGTLIQREGNNIYFVFNGRIVDERKWSDWVEAPVKELPQAQPDGARTPPHLPADVDRVPDVNRRAVALLDEHFRLLPQLHALADHRRPGTQWPDNRIAGTREFRELGVDEWAGGSVWSDIMKSLGENVQGKSGPGEGMRVVPMGGRVTVRDLYEDLKSGRLLCTPPPDDYPPHRLK